MTINNKSLLSLCCALTFVFAACEAKDSSTSPYPVYDSGMWADPLHDPEIYWIDNNRVLFKAVKDNDKRNISRGPFNLSLWEIGKGVKPYTDYYQSVTACIQGDMFYRTQKDAQGNVQRFYGRFGEEKSFEFPETKGIFFDEMNCYPNDNPEILAKRSQGHAIRPLLDRHGYLDLGPLSGDKNNFVNFHRADGKVIELPLRKGDIWTPEQREHYVAFRRAYFISTYHYDDTLRRSTGNIWPKNVTRYVWWLYPDGRVESVRFPDGPWIQETKPGSGYVTYNTRLYPTRQGYFLGAGKSKGPKDAGTAGAFLLRDGKLTKLIGGHFRNPSVSPDGCKVAFVHYPYGDATIANDPAPIRLKAVDLCDLPPFLRPLVGSGSASPVV